MADVIKFTEEELNALRQLQTTYSNVVSNLGQTELQLTEAERNLETLKEQKLQLIQAYESAKQQENALFAQINEKYGAGNLDIATGVFTPAQAEEEAVEQESIEVPAEVAAE